MRAALLFLLLALASCSNGRNCYPRYDAVNLGLPYNAPLCGP